MMHNDECQAMNKIPSITDLACITEKSEINNHLSKERGTYMQEKVALEKSYNALNNSIHLLYISSTE